jgi:hypothetical protein
LVKFLRRFAIVAFALGATAACANDFADSLFKAAQKAEKAGDTLHAYLLYARASALDPKNMDYAARKQALRAITAMSVRETLGPDPVAADHDEDADTPDDGTAISALDVVEARRALPPPQLIASPELKTFDLKGDARTIFEKVGQAYDFNLVFEPDYPTSPPFNFRMTEVGYQEALHALEAVTNSFVVVVGPKVALVVRDTAQKRAEREPVIATAIPIPERLSAQDAQELIQAVTATLDVRRISADASKHLFIIRDKVSKVLAAEQLLDTLMHARPQIEIEVQFLETGKTSSLSYGIDLPNEISLVNFSNFMNNAASIQPSFTSFLRIGGGATLMGLGITNASAFAAIAKATANSLMEAHVVALDGQTTSLLVGEHYPIITNQYIGNTSGATGIGTAGQVFVPPPTINYEDLGVVLKITPTINGNDEVMLDVDAEFKVLGATDPNTGIPIISNRKFNGKVSLKDGEWGVLTGLLGTTDSDSLTGYPGISNVPFLRRLLGQSTILHDSDRVLLVLKPRLMNLPAWEYPQRTIWVGTDTRPVTIF